MAWSWWDDDLEWHPFTSSSTSISTSTLHLLSLVLPHSCSFRERERVINGRVKWASATSAEVWCIHFMHMTSGTKVKVENNSFPTHSMQLNYWRMIRYRIRFSGDLWTHGIGPDTRDMAAGPTHLFQGLITWLVTPWVEVTCSLVIVLTIVDFMFVRLAGHSVE